MSQKLILAKSTTEANHYAKTIGLERFTYRAVRNAGAIRGVRNAEVHLLSSFTKRVDRFAILDALRWARSLEVFYVVWEDGAVLDGTEDHPRFVAGPKGTADVKNPVDDPEEISEPSPAPESSEDPAPTEEPRGRTRRRFRVGGDAALHFLSRDGLLAGQALRAFGLAARQRLLGLRQLQVRLRALQGHLEGTRVDAEQRLAGAHDLAFAEQRGLDVTGHTRADLDPLGRLDATNLGKLRLKRLLQHRRDRDHRCDGALGCAGRGRSDGRLASRKRCRGHDGHNRHQSGLLKRGSLRGPGRTVGHGELRVG